MKKKLLSLVLAGAMVASTSVSAFAAGTTVIEKPDTEEPKQEIQITGEVYSEDNAAPSGTFNVTVPTAAAFTVDSSGNLLVAEKMTIRNDGRKGIDVYADKFVDSTKSQGEGITVVEEQDIKSKNRAHVSLKLTGGLDTAYFKTEDTTQSGNNGVYKDNTLLDKATDGVKLVNIQSGEQKDLTLSGTAGSTNAELSDEVKQKGTTDTFTLTLKIKKSEN